MKNLLSLILLLSFTIKAQDVKIGTQTWMSKNLDVSKFRNGEAIPLAKTNAEWAKAGENKQPAWCHYDNDPANGTKYGKLYNWYAVNDPRGLAPEGWHVPSQKEFDGLIKFMDGETDAAIKLKSDSGWSSFEGQSGNGINKYAFNALPGGYLGYYCDYFEQINYVGAWWTTTQIEEQTILFYMSFRIPTFHSDLWSKEAGFSVRCIKN